MRYALAGASFGAAFPIFATLLDSSLRFGSLSAGTLLAAQRTMPLHWIIDSAPFWLGLFAAIAGRREDALRSMMTELRGLNRSLETVNADLAKASRVKSEFLANMSHELRTPLNAVIGFTDLVVQKSGAELAEKNRKNLERALAAARSLTYIIGGILDLTRIEAGKLELVRENVDLAALLEVSASTAEVLLQGKPVRLIRSIDPALPRIHADQARVQQIVLNLLSNACKFTESGEVLLAASPLPGGRVRIDVRDTGIGIAETDLPGIFEEFHQVDNTARRKYGGAGLGLSLVKRLVGLMNGTIEVKSVPGTGTLLRVELPTGFAAANAA